VTLNPDAIVAESDYNGGDRMVAFRRTSQSVVVWEVTLWRLR
jgi:hypothetical protein